MLAVVSGSIVLPTKMLIGLSAYQNSKLALIKTVEYLSVENPNIFCSAVHPGMVDTKIFRKSGATPEVLPMDTGKYPLICFMKDFANEKPKRSFLRVSWSGYRALKPSS